MRTALPSLVVSLVVMLGGCSSQRSFGVRVLDTALPASPRAEVEPEPAAAPARIGAPGGSGAGSRRVAPVQSGKETVGGLPAGIGGGVGPRG